MDKLAVGDPQHVGGYRLLARLGAGGLGQVYLARSDRGRTVALRLVHRGLAEQPMFRERFRLEVAAARRVAGEWTAAVVDAGTEAEMPWLATDYVPGLSLRAVVSGEFFDPRPAGRAPEGRGALPERSVRVLAAGLAQALRDIHAAGLIHRDLKPSNVILTVNGPCVIDFGMARALETVGDRTVTRSGPRSGGDGFLAPEQIRGDRVTAACDVFGLGAVLAFAATGRPPFGERDDPGRPLRVRGQEPDLSGLPPGLLELVRDCLRNDPVARPTTAEILARAGGPAYPDDGTAGEPWLPQDLTRVHPPTTPLRQPPALSGPDLGAGAGAGADLTRVPPPAPVRPQPAPLPLPPAAARPAQPYAPQPANPPVAQGRSPYGPPPVAQDPCGGPPTGPVPNRYEPPRYGPPPAGPPAPPAGNGFDTPAPYGTSAPQNPPRSPVRAADGGGPAPEEPPATRRGRVLALIAAAVVVVVGAGTFGYWFLTDTGSGDRAAAQPRLSAAPAPAPTPREEPPPPSSPSPTTVKPGAIPAEYLGTWTGGVGKGAAFAPRRLVVRQGKVGEPVLSLTADGPTGPGGYHCVFEAPLASVPQRGKSVLIGPSKVTAAKPKSACTPGLPTELTVLDSGTLRRVAAGGETITYTKTN